MIGMMLRTSPQFEQALAETGIAASPAFSELSAQATVEAKTHRGFGPECFSTTKQTLSFDGQQASPSAMLSVFFRAPVHTGGGRERIGGSGVVFLTKATKGSQAWAFLKSFWHSQWPLALLAVGKLSRSRQSVVLQSAQVRPSSQAAAFCKVLPSGQGQTYWPVRPNCSAVNNPIIRAIARILSHRIAAQGFPLRGFLRFSKLFHHHKGLAYVQ